MQIRAMKPEDWDEVWAILEPVFRAGETYAVPPDIEEHEARRLWTRPGQLTFVAEDPRQKQVLGTYFLRANQEGPGAHVCNCGYVVSELSRGRGVASAMCEHSQREAVARGYRAMQFNLVTSTNAGAVRLWQRLGFEIVGTLPGAFHHPQLGFVDAHVMFKSLVDGSPGATQESS